MLNLDHYHAWRIKKRRLLTTNEIFQAIKSEKGHLLKLIEQQPVAPQSEADGQSVNEQPLEQQPIEDQVKMNSGTPLTGEQPEEQAECVSSKNKRGQTQMHNVHARKERKLVLLNRLNQPVGPTEDVVTELSSFLGTLARNVTLCPFDIFDWRSMDTKKDLWDYTKAWRRHRSDLKINYYDPYDNDEIRMAKKPGHIPECQFGELLKYWKFEKFKEKEEEFVSAKELFVVTRTRKPDRLYKASNENTTSKIAEMEEIEKQMSTNGQSVDAFSTVMGPKHLGRLRLYGVGVTKTTLKKKVDNSEPTLNATNDVVQQMQERMQKMEKQMEEQRRTMQQDIIADVVAQLQDAGLIDPNILAALSVPSPREAISAEQGDDIEEGDESSTEDLTSELN
ncbi:hypothetical protein H5410_063872 [Solanum commersonii]|uniref:Transposase, Ptta/En/Spm, plant n=1 Tax=Solanum commersonii TaxID=4109 RepID=A0A9J5WER2_SOLCO|nr:hypothetical protein H5410_063872 [Solanum commersonii]